MMNYRDVPQSIKRLFPWGLFLVVAALFALGAMVERAHGEEDIWACYASSRYQAMSSGWPPCTEMCGRLKGYLQTHTEAEARAKAVEMHLPQWVIRKAEKCIP